MNRPTLPPPAMTTRISVPSPCRPGRAAPSSVVDGVGRATARYTTSPSWATRSGVGELRRAQPADAPTTRTPALLDVEQPACPAQPTATPRSTRRPWRSGRPTRRRPRRAAPGAAPARSSTRRWPRWGCRGAGRWRPGGGRRCGRPPARSRRSPGRPGRRGCSSCRRWSPRRAPRPRSMPASMRRSRSKPMPDDLAAGEVVAEPAERLRPAVDDGDGVAVCVAGSPASDEPDPAAADDDDVHLASSVDAVRPSLRRAPHRPYGLACRDSVPAPVARVRRARRVCARSLKRILVGRPDRHAPRRGTSGSPRRSRCRSSPPTPSRPPPTRPTRSCSCSLSRPASAWRRSTTSCRSRSSSVVLLAIVVTSYRQTIYAYPSGGGAYIVVRGEPRRDPVARRRRVAARRLHPHRRRVGRRRRAGDPSAVPASTASGRVPICLAAASLLMTVANLRGAEGVGRAVRPADVPLHRHAAAADRGRASTGSSSATSARSRSTTLAGGVAELANGHQVADLPDAAAGVLVGRRRPVGRRGGVQRRARRSASRESKNAATTLMWMGAILGTCFLGVSVLAAPPPAVPRRARPDRHRPDGRAHLRRQERAVLDHCRSRRSPS